MKILVISEYYPTREKVYSGRYIKQQMDEMVKLGHQVDVLIPLRNSNDELKKVELPDNCYFTMGYSTNRYELFPLKTAKIFANALYKMCEENKYDLISVHLTSDTLLANIALVSNKLNIPFVQHYHGLNVWEEYVTVHPYRQKFYAWRRARILNKAAALVGVSNKVSEAIKSRLDNKRVYTVYNGVNTEIFVNVNGDSNSTDSKLIKIVSVGRLIYTKGHHILIDAIKFLTEKYDNFMVEIIGDGPEMERLTEKINKNHLQEKIILSGRKDYIGVATSLREADLFVLPSYYEALGCVYLEAMACGLPSIGVYGMGIDEIIKDGVNGYLVKPQSVDDLIDSIEKYINLNVEERQAMSKKAFETADNYTWQHSAQRLEECYKAVIEK